MNRVYIKIIKTWTYEDLPEDIKEKVLEKYWDINIDHEWYNFDGLLDLNQEEIDRAGIIKEEYNYNTLFSYKNFNFSIDREWYIQFNNLTCNNDEVFRKFLGIPKNIWNLIYYSFTTGYGQYTNTQIQFKPNGHYNRDFSPRIQKILDLAEEKFNNKIDQALSILSKQYDYLTSRKAIEETLIANEYEFTEAGNIY